MMGNIIRHLTQGWGNGYYLPVKYIELWNEPDLQAKVFWKGSREEFYKTYEAAARGIKSADSTIAVGGPALPGFTIPTPSRWIKGFLDYCQRNNVPWISFLAFNMTWYRDLL
jgi:xylan 1,4-beta-xylosidase